jgi:hypothetical protein
MACITFLIFVPWKKGPAWYLKFSHYLFFGLLITNYILLPLTNIGVETYFICWKAIDLKIEPIESYIIFFNIVCFMRIIEFVTIVRRTVLLDARIFLEIRSQDNVQTKEELNEMLINEKGDTNEEMGLKNVHREMLSEMD